MVCKLHKALYSVKQALMACSEKLRGALLSFGFNSAKSYQSQFTKITLHCTIYIQVYFDDVLITGNDPHAILFLFRI